MYTSYRSLMKKTDFCSSWNVTLLWSKLLDKCSFTQHKDEEVIFINMILINVIIEMKVLQKWKLYNNESAAAQTAIQPLSSKSQLPLSRRSWGELMLYPRHSVSVLFVWTWLKFLEQVLYLSNYLSYLHQTRVDDASINNYG